MQPTSEIFAGSSHVLLRPWHQGGRLELYEAEYLRHGERRIVLLASPESLSGRQGAGGWLDGARAAAAVRHPYLLRLAAAGPTKTGGAYAAYPMTAHRTARHVLDQSGPFSLERACDVALCVLSALQLAHASGFIHGAVGLDTVLLAPDANTPPPVLVLGLGACAALAALPTPDCAPELLSSAPLTERGDVYSVAVLLVSLLAPDSVSAPRDWVLGAPIPEPLRDTLLSALDPDPLARQSTARLLASELLSLAGNANLFQLRLEIKPYFEEPQGRAAIHPNTVVRSERSNFTPSEEPARERLRAAVVPCAPTLPQVTVPRGQGSRPKPLPPEANDDPAATWGLEHALAPASSRAPPDSAADEPTVLTKTRPWPGWRQAAVLTAAGFSAGLWLAWLSGLI